MKFSPLVFVLILGFGFLVFGCVQPPVTPTPTPSEIASPTIKVSPTEIPTATPQASPVSTPPTLPKNLSETEFVSLCNSYATSAEKQGCLQTAAYKFNNSSLCTGITSFDQRVLCSGLASLDPTKCNQISSVEVKNDCYKLVAIGARDENLCEKMIMNSRFDIYAKMDCLASIAFYESNARICEAYFTGDLARFKPVCLALAGRSKEECEKTSDEMIKSDCYSSLAVALLDGNYCLFVNGVAERAVCFSRVAQAQYLRG